jgi:hypothetical protein
LARRGLWSALLGALLLTAGPSNASAGETAARHRSVLVLFVAPASPAVSMEAELAGIRGLSVGIMSATQGVYRTAQLLLDITQGARVSYSAYTPSRPPALSVLRGPQGATVTPWPAVLERANSAPQTLHPGALAAAIPGKAGYVGITGQADSDAVMAADRAGHISEFSLGDRATLEQRIASLSERVGLLVADLPGGSAGLEDLRELDRVRTSGQLLIVIERAPDSAGHELLWSAVGGLSADRALSSQTTNEYGLIAAIDLAPTILHYLRLPVPRAMRGDAVHTDGALDGSYLRFLKSRLEVVYSRRLPALCFLLAGWLVLVLCARNHRGWALRVGALGMLFLPVAVLVPAALGPGRTVEYLTLVLLCFALGASSDRLIRWPRALLAPAVAAIVALSADALAGTQLLARSLLGPNPAFGARFYGIGNELKAGLAVLVFAAVAAALYPAVRSRRAACTMACAGIVLAIVEGSARIGAGVGGVFLVSAGTAMATVMLLPGEFNRKRVLIVMVAPVLGLIALAGIDLATAHGGGHFTGSVLDASSASDIRDIIVRRYGAAREELANGLMPLATALALIAPVLAIRRRDRVLAPVDSDPAWLAALGGGLTAGVIGALTEDSGPVLLVVAVFALVCVLGYLWGKPAPQPTAQAKSRKGFSMQTEPIT